MATAICLEDTLLMTLSKEAYTSVIGKIEQRMINEKIAFLRELPIFSRFTRSTLQTVLYGLEKMSVVRKKFLFHEGEPCSHVFIITRGEFEVTTSHAVDRSSGEGAETSEFQQIF
jgi:hypothetical protein